MGKEIGLLPERVTSGLFLWNSSYGTPELASETRASQGRARASGSDLGSVCSGLEEGLAHHHPVPVGDTCKMKFWEKERKNKADIQNNKPKVSLDSTDKITPSRWYKSFYVCLCWLLRGQVTNQMSRSKES